MRSNRSGVFLYLRYASTWTGAECYANRFFLQRHGGSLRLWSWRRGGLIRILFAHGLNVGFVVG